jgi:hypothetical protein
MGQILGTKAFGLLEVEQSWVVVGKQNEAGKEIQRGGHVALLTNGAFINITGLPFSSEDEINEILCTPDMRPVRDRAINWFRNRHLNEEKPLQKIMFDTNGYPCFEDGSFVEKPDDLVECLQNAPLLMIAMAGLNKRLEAVAAETRQKTPPHIKGVINKPSTMAANKKAAQKGKHGKASSRPAAKPKETPLSENTVTV